MNKDIALVMGDDWKGVYIDGKLVYEGHSIHWEHVLEKLGFGITALYADEQWLEHRGYLPESLLDVRLEK